MSLFKVPNWLNKLATDDQTTVVTIIQPGEMPPLRQQGLKLQGPLRTRVIHNYEY